MCQKDKYWGRGGAGMLFLCQSDNTLLLTLRSFWVAQGGTWGIPGGSIEEGWYSTPIQKPVDDENIYINTAYREVIEECGTLPPDFSSNQIFDKTEYTDCGFKYVTLIANITSNQKNNWEHVSNDGETDRFEWFSVRKLPPNLHFGVEYTLSKMNRKEITGLQTNLY